MKEKIIGLYKKGLFHIVGSSVLNKIIGFVSAFILVRLLSINEYGLYSYANNIIVIFLIFSGLGVSSGLLQFGSENIKNKDKQDAYLLYTCKLGCIINIFLAIVIIIISSYGIFSVPKSNNIVRLMAFLPFLKFFVEVYQINFRIRVDNKRFSVFNTIVSGILLVSSIIGAIINGILGVIIAQYVAYIIILIIGNRISKEPIYKIINNYTLNKVDKKEFLKVSLISCFSNGISELLYNIDIIIIGYFLVSRDIIATYKTATIIPFALNSIPLTLVTYIYPEYASHKDNLKWIKKEYKKLLLRFGMFNLFLSGILMIFAKYIVEILFGQAYLEAIPIFRILAIGYFFAGTFRIISGNVLLMLRQVKFNFYVSIFSGILNIILNILLIPMWGSIGAAYATISVYITTSIISTTYLVIFINKKRGE